MSGLAVSRETHERLAIYAALLRKWNKKINLVSPSTIDALEERHFADSLQVLEHAPAEFDHWVDIGSGGGFPGLVAAIALADRGAAFTLVESDQRKCVFLRTVIRETDVKANVISQRIEEVDPLNASVLSARALAPLSVLLSFCDRHLHKNGAALFLKGETWREEVAEAEIKWNFHYERFTSGTDQKAQILRIEGVSRA